VSPRRATISRPTSRGLRDPAEKQNKANVAPKAHKTKTMGRPGAFAKQSQIRRKERAAAIE